MFSCANTLFCDSVRKNYHVRQQDSSPIEVSAEYIIQPSFDDLSEDQRQAYEALKKQREEKHREEFLARQKKEEEEDMEVYLASFKKDHQGGATQLGGNKASTNTPVNSRALYK
jgi:hypothetical protein